MVGMACVYAGQVLLMVKQFVRCSPGYRKGEELQWNVVVEETERRGWVRDAARKTEWKVVLLRQSATRQGGRTIGSHNTMKVPRLSLPGHES